MTEKTDRFWIARPVSAHKERNEYYDDWWEFRWITDTEWRRISRNQYRHRYQWRPYHPGQTQLDRKRYYND